MRRSRCLERVVQLAATAADLAELVVDDQHRRQSVGRRHLGRERRIARAGRLELQFLARVPDRHMRGQDRAQPHNLSRKTE